MRGLGYHVYVLMGDGELEEGEVWEAAMAAAHLHLDGLTVFVDANRLQVDGRTAQIMNSEPLVEKWRAFGWHVQDIDGHDMAAILQAVARAHATNGRPSAIIARTVKGKGVSFMENQALAQRPRQPGRP